MEENIIIKDWANINISFGLIYPNIYEIGMSSYAIRLLYSILNSNRDVACERIFLPMKIRYPASKDLSSKDIIRSIENKMLPEHFDILGFSVQYENDFKNILWILDKAGIPLIHDERKKKNMNGEPDYPIIIGGGAVITSNPLPLSNYFDLLFIGDSELNLSKFLDIFQEYKNNQISLMQLLQKSALIKGIYVPSLNNKIEREVLQEINAFQIPHRQIVNVNKNQKKIFQNNFLLEINRGCPFQCKFCISSFHNSPFRNRSYENIINIIEDEIKMVNFKSVTLIGSCISAHPKFYEICKYLISKGLKITIPSIRLEHVNQKIIKIFEKANINTITIAPETGSEDLRFELGKKISNDTILSIANQIKDSSIRNIKFYFLIGLPNEKEENIMELISLLKKISDLGFNKNTLRVNINPFVPKFNTPYEKKIEFFLDKNYYTFRTKFKILEQNLRKIPSIKIKFQDVKKIIKNARFQALLSLGDLEISTLLNNYYFYGANFGALRKVQNDMRFDMNEYFSKIQSGYHPWNI